MKTGPVWTHSVIVTTASAVVPVKFQTKTSVNTGLAMCSHIVLTRWEVFTVPVFLDMKATVSTAMTSMNATTLLSLQGVYRMLNVATCPPISSASVYQDLKEMEKSNAEILTNVKILMLAD